MQLSWIFSYDCWTQISLSSEVGLIQLLETAVGPFFVWAGGYESPPMYTVIGGSVLLTTLACYFSHSLIVEKRSAAEAHDSPRTAALEEGEVTPYSSPPCDKVVITVLFVLY